MRTISLRAFRAAIADQTEPVSVVRRNADTGDLDTLGTWTPVSTMTDTRAIDGIRPGEPGPHSPGAGHVEMREQPPFRPVPKPGKRK